MAGYIPEKSPAGRRLISCDDFWASLDEDAADISRDLVDRTLMDSITASYRGFIDFDDQIYMSTLFAGTFPRFPLFLVAEPQDFPAINYPMLEKPVVNRLIAVADLC